MNKQCALSILSMAMVGLLAAAPGNAALKSYEVSGIVSQSDNPGQMTGPFSTASVGDNLKVDFTIDTAALGALNAPGDMSYLSPLTALSASIGANTLGLNLDLNQIEIQANALVGGAYSTQFQLLSFANVAPDFTGVATAFALITGGSSPNPTTTYKNASLSNAPLQPAKATDIDAMLLEFTSYIDGVQQAVSDLFVGTDVSVKRVSSGGHFAAPEMDPASAGSALTLLLGGLVVLCGGRARRGGAAA